MTDEQERKPYKMDDQKLLIELAIAYGNTNDADLGDYHRRNLMAIFADLNLDHMINYIYHCPSCDKDIKNLLNARHNMGQCPHCKHADDLTYFAKEGSDTKHE